MKLQHASVPAAQRSTHTYDARNPLTFIDHPIGTSDVSYGYFADGSLQTAATATSTWNYSYDKRGLLRNETLATNEFVSVVSIAAPATHSRFLL